MYIYIALHRAQTNLFPISLWPFLADHSLARWWIFLKFYLATVWLIQSQSQAVYTQIIIDYVSNTQDQHANDKKYDSKLLPECSFAN